MPPQEQVKALVTVKAYPALSSKYGETVCVAGVRTDTPRPEWVRLFPVGFRELAYTDQFAKYQHISLRAFRGTDLRPESFKPNLSTLTLGARVGTTNSWRDRWAILEPLAGAITMCQLLRAQYKPAAPSLGLVRPIVQDLVVEPNPDFAADRRALAQALAAEDLFGVQRDELEPAPFRLKYKYRCEGEPCRNGHTQSVIDWEAGQAARAWRSDGASDADVMAKLREKWLDELCSPGRDTYFYVGNQHLRPKVFMVLGVFWPPAGSRPPAPLF